MLIFQKVDYLEDLMSEDTKNLQKTITTLKQENALLKSEVEELDEEMTTQRTTGFKCFSVCIFDCDSVVIARKWHKNTFSIHVKISFPKSR